MKKQVRSSCRECGSFAINHHLHDRDGSDGDLCDVCYWKKRAKVTEQLYTFTAICGCIVDVFVIKAKKKPTVNQILKTVYKLKQEDISNFKNVYSFKFQTVTVTKM